MKYATLVVLSLFVALACPHASAETLTLRLESKAPIAGEPIEVEVTVSNSSMATIKLPNFGSAFPGEIVVVLEDNAFSLQQTNTWKVKMGAFFDWRALNTNETLKFKITLDKNFVSRLDLLNPMQEDGPKWWAKWRRASKIDIYAVIREQQVASNVLLLQLPEGN